MYVVVSKARENSTVHWLITRGDGYVGMQVTEGRGFSLDVFSSSLQMWYLSGISPHPLNLYSSFLQRNVDKNKCGSCYDGVILETCPLCIVYIYDYRYGIRLLCFLITTPPPCPITSSVLM